MRRPRLAAGLAALGLLSGGAASGYRFYDAGEASLAPSAAAAARWRASVWGPGESLEWRLADDPGWTSAWTGSEGKSHDPPFTRIEDAVPLVEAALAAWAAVGSADIRWHLSGVEPGPGIEKDERNSLTVRPNDGGFGGLATYRFERRDEESRWEIVECDIEISPLAAAYTRSDSPRSLSTLLHEFGHCLGLAHAAAHPLWGGWRERDYGIWGESPKMSYGRALGNGLTADDIVGASLLRPAEGWPASTASVAGRVTVSGQPAPFVSVLSARLADGARAPGPSAFTDEEGRFALEGLPPGTYLIAAGSLTEGRAHGRLLEGGAELDARDGFRLDPVALAAGESRTDLALDLAAGRAGSGPG